MAGIDHRVVALLEALVDGTVGRVFLQVRRVEEAAVGNGGGQVGQMERCAADLTLADGQ